MKIQRSWAFWRRIQYGAGFFSFWLVVGAGIYFGWFYQLPNCFDQKQNGEETGVDCGGACVRICAADVLPPQVVWAKSFKIADGQYNVVGYVENPNQVAATPELVYKFELLNNGQVVASQTGTTILPPNSMYPIFEGRVFTDGDADVTDTKLTLEPVALWLPAAVGRDQFRSLDIDLSNADTRPRLDVQFENTALTAADDIEVVATIFNGSDTPVTSSQTFVPHLEPRSTTNLVFTWPNSIAKTVKSCIIPTDVALAIDLSGSMNNDGGNPPQPVAAALEAAAQFVNNLKKDDQVALITFATDAVVYRHLGSDQTAAAKDVLGLAIDPKEETGYTNTTAAFKQAQAELNAPTHNPDARRVLVLLTDGLPTARGREIVDETASAAVALRDDNIDVYAIGLGENVDRGFIERIASDRTKAFIAPTSVDLKKIYQEITSSLCEVGPTKIDVVAKTKANFAPLR